MSANRAFFNSISSLDCQENHYSNREVDELDEQKVNFKVSQINKRVIYVSSLYRDPCTIRNPSCFGCLNY